MKRDPVCNMEVREEDAVTAECNGEVLYFCSEGCREKFLKERLWRRSSISWVAGRCAHRQLLDKEAVSFTLLSYSLHISHVN
jgi:YHS domain-containing protein